MTPLIISPPTKCNDTNTIVNNTENIKYLPPLVSNEEKTKLTPLSKRKKQVITISDDDEFQSDEQSNTR